jgi:hypothetical protein
MRDQQEKSNKREIGVTKRRENAVCLLVGGVKREAAGALPIINYNDRRRKRKHLQRICTPMDCDRL